MSAGAIIARERKRMGLSLRDLSARTGIWHSHLSELETGLRPNPKWDSMVMISRELGLSLDQIANESVAQPAAK